MRPPRAAAARSDPLRQDAQLPATNRSEHVAHAVIETEARVLVMRRAIAGLSGKKSRAFNQ